MNDRYLDQVKAIVLRALAAHPVSVYLFGSRARGDARRALKTLGLEQRMTQP